MIGGLSGAKERNFPYSGNSFGSAYRQAFGWINQHAEKNSKVVFVFEHHPNIPSIFLRSDLELQNRNRSGFLRLGEYAVTLTYQGIENRSHYDMYLEKFIEPVYQSQVDGVPIVKVWKNDRDHLKILWPEFQDDKVSINKSKSGLSFDLGEVRKLSRLEIEYNQENCPTLASGVVLISRDGEVFDKLPGVLPTAWRISILGQQPADGKFIEPFVGQEARYIHLDLLPEDTCLNNMETYKIYYFD